MPLNMDFVANVRPSARQLAWQRMEMYGFIHFGMNTMTDREWGLGHEDPALFDPVHVDADQWAAAFKAAGMTGMILTCKHHDGFCLWPSAYTAHSVASSPWRSGRGDLVREASEAAARHGLRFGIYLSPWDRTEATYGQGTAYDDFYVNQLTELLTGYGPIFSVWLDGANGEGSNGKTQQYDWARYYNVIRALQPEAVISVCGPDVRWAGNEAGHVRADEWSVVPARLRSAELTAEKSQRQDDPSLVRAVRSEDEDLGSRGALEPYGDALAWYPAEVDTSIRPGWFHHADQDDRVKSADELFSLWRAAVGGNCTLLLNAPPNRDGLLAEPDVRALRGLGRRIAGFRERVITVAGAAVRASSGEESARAAFAGGSSSSGRHRSSGHWRIDPHDDAPELTIAFPSPERVEAVVLEEDIRVGQRIEDLVVDGIGTDGRILEIGAVHAIGYRRIITIDALELAGLRIRIRRSRGAAALSRVAAVRAAS